MLVNEIDILKGWFQKDNNDFYFAIFYSGKILQTKSAKQNPAQNLVSNPFGFSKQPLTYCYELDTKNIAYIITSCYNYIDAQFYGEKRIIEIRHCSCNFKKSKK